MIQENKRQSALSLQQQLADAWMALSGWQRGVIGTLMVLVAGFLIIIVMTAAVMFLT